MAKRLLFQLTDIHVVADRGSAPFPGRHPLASLDAALATIAGAEARPDAVVLTGDLADAGDAAAYRLLAARFDRLRSETGAIVVFVPGNHDRREAMAAALLPAHRPGSAGMPIDQVHWVGGLRIVSLDSVVPGEVGGALRAEQLSWLATELETPAPEGTVLTLHHPPIASPVRPMAACALAEPDRLGEVLEGSEVLVVLAGHNHHATAGILGRVPVWVGPALSYRSDPLSERDYVPLAGSAFSRVDIEGGTARVTFVPLMGPDDSAQPVPESGLGQASSTH